MSQHQHRVAVNQLLKQLHYLPANHSHLHTNYKLLFHHAIYNITQRTARNHHTDGETTISGRCMKHYCNILLTVLNDCWIIVILEQHLSRITLWVLPPQITIFGDYDALQILLLGRPTVVGDLMLYLCPF